MNKIMETIFFIFAILFILSCSNSINEGPNSTIMGKWHLINIRGIRCEVCPIVYFNKDNTGKITKPSGTEIIFDYDLFPNKMIFSFNEDVDIGYFEELDFYYKTYVRDSSLILELNSLHGTSKYLLAREK